MGPEIEKHEVGEGSIKARATREQSVCSNGGLPGLTQQPIEYIDQTPDKDYPLRILKAFRQHCGCNWETHGLDEAQRRVYDMMNDDNIKRAWLLDKAIEKLAG